MAVSDDGLSVACGDEVGKIYYVTNPKGSSSLIVQTFHWHSQAVSCLEFVQNAPILMSGGKEAVLVQWHLEQQDKTFVSRVGHEITKFSMTPTYYSTLLADNTVKVIRVDNNKPVLTTQLLNLAENPVLSAFGKQLVSVNGTKIQVLQDITTAKCQMIDVKPRNFVSNPCDRNLPSSKIMAHCFVGEHLVSVDTLKCSETGICTQSLKFFRQQEGEYEMSQFVHLYETVDNVVMAPIGKDTVMIAIGETLYAWRLVNDSWVRIIATGFQGLKVRQIHTDKRLRVADVSKAAQIAVLFAEGHLVFFDQNDFSLTYNLPLFKDCR